MRSPATKWVSSILVAAGLSLAAIAPGAAAADMSSWTKQVAGLIAKNQGYPRSAQIRKLEGTAKVKLVIADNGTISSFNLEQSSGHEILDAEVDKLVEKINPLPAPPSGNEMTLVVPLSWRLN